MQAGHDARRSATSPRPPKSRAPPPIATFPSQAALVHAVVDAGLGPILEWDSTVRRCRGRAWRDLLAQSMPRIDEFEATFKAALKLSLEQWAQQQRRHARRRAALQPRPPRRPAAGPPSRRCARLIAREAIQAAGAGAVAGPTASRSCIVLQGHLGPRARRGAGRGAVGRPALWSGPRSPSAPRATSHCNANQ